MVMRNISQFVVEDNENQTAYLNLPQNIWWYWYGSEFEAEAYYLKLLAAVEPKSPVAPRLVKYLINNRKHATYWNSTRDTALVIEALADYIKASGEDKPDLTVEVWVDGQKRKEDKDRRRQSVHVRQRVRARRRSVHPRPAHGRTPQIAAPARCTGTATSRTSRSKTTSATPASS